MAYDKTIPLFSTSIEEYRNISSRVYFRKWSIVSSELLENTKVTIIEEDNSIIYVCSTDYFVPWWLNNIDPPSNETLPQDYRLPDFVTGSVSLAWDSFATDNSSTPNNKNFDQSLTSLTAKHLRISKTESLSLNISESFLTNNDSSCIAEGAKADNTETVASVCGKSSTQGYTAELSLNDFQQPITSCIQKMNELLDSGEEVNEIVPNEKSKLSQSLNMSLLTSNCDERFTDATHLVDNANGTNSASSCTENRILPSWVYNVFDMFDSTNDENSVKIPKEIKNFSFQTATQDVTKEKSGLSEIFSKGLDNSVTSDCAECFINPTMLEDKANKINSASDYTENKVVNNEAFCDGESAALCNSGKSALWSSKLSDSSEKTIAKTAIDSNNNVPNRMSCSVQSMKVSEYDIESNNSSLSYHSGEGAAGANHLLTMLEFLRKISLIEEYNSDRINRQQELKKLFEDAARKTAVEQLNLQQKGEKTGRYVNIMKRLSNNSSNICEEAIFARDLYNKKVKDYNDTLKKPKKIEFNPEINSAFEYFRTKIFSIEKECLMPFYLTKFDYEDTEEYANILKTIRAQIEKDQN